jgi:hypothetical protein
MLVYNTEKFALTVLAVSMVTVHESLPWHAPDQPLNTKPLSGLATRPTVVPDAYSEVQAEPQFIPPGSLVMVPFPELLVVRV